MENTPCCCEPNYREEYYRQQEAMKRLIDENEQLKEALLKLALKL